MLSCPMEIKGFFKKIQNTSSSPREYYLAVLLEENFVRTAFWALTEEEVVEVVGIGEKIFFENSEGIVEAVDRSLSSVFFDKEFKGVIFGVPSTWLSQGQLKEDKLEILKRICREMDLSAIGFVFNTEALIYHLKLKEGIPLTAILISFSPKKLVVSLVKLGKVIKTEEVIRSGNLKEDIVEAFYRFKDEEVLPARIILYNQEDLKEEIEQIEEIPWEEKGINFIHLPKIETLPLYFETLSLALAGGRELGQAERVVFRGEVASKKEESETELKKITQEGELEKKEETALEEGSLLPEETQPQEQDFKKEIVVDNFGFVKGEDILLRQEKEKEEQKTPPSIASFEKESLKTDSLSRFEKPKIKSFSFSGGRKIFDWLLSLISIFKNKKEGFRNLSLPKIRSKLALVLLVVFGSLGGLFFLGWWFLPKSTITLWVKPQVLEKSFLLTLDSNASEADEEKLILPAEKIKLVLTKEGSKETTGTKIEGEPASGEVIIYNRTPNLKTFPQGTEIIGPDNLKFTLEEEVLVASESVGSDYVKVPGKAKVKIKAVAIGPEGNLAAGTEFNVDNYSKSDFVAKNEEAFSGGTKREIQVVSRQDLEELEKNLLEELKNQAEKEIGQKVSSNQKIISDSLSFEIKNKEFDKNVGEEADKVKLRLEVEFSVLSYSEEDLGRLLEQEISQLIPEGFEYKPEEKELEFKLKELKDKDTAVFEANLKAFLFPKLDVGVIKNNLKGKTLTAGKNYLDSLKKVDSYQVKIFPQFPKKLVTFPHVSKNITIEVKRK